MLAAVGTGKTLTTTFVVAGALLVQPLEFVTVSEYVPAIARVALNETVGLWMFDVKPPGPVHE